MPAWAVRATKESDKINMGWGWIKYSSIGVTEWCSLPNTASIKLPDRATRTQGTGATSNTKVLGSSSAISPESAASAPKTKAESEKAESEKVAQKTTVPETSADYSHEIVIRFPVLVNTRDLLPGEELFRRETKPSKNESIIQWPSRPSCARRAKRSRNRARAIDTVSGVGFSPRATKAWVAPRLH